MFLLFRDRSRVGAVEKGSEHLDNEFGLEVPFGGGGGEPKGVPYCCFEEEGDFWEEEAGYGYWGGCVHGARSGRAGPREQKGKGTR